MKTTSLNIPHQRRVTYGTGAFSLVEVTIAVAIAALGFTTLLGLLPQSISMARDSAELSVGSKIMQKLSGELQSTSWDRITWQGYSPLRYFTSEGTEVTSADAADATELAAAISYVASVYVPEKPLDVILPAGSGGGGTTSGQPETYLRRIKICVATSVDPSFDFASASPLRVTSAYALVAKMGN